MTVFTLILITLTGFTGTSAKPKTECGYKQCPVTREGALNVHLIPHSHMDAGWVKTFDEYYYGTKTSTSSANVQLIYHSVLAELLHDKRRRFTFSETSYFWRWWKEQRPAVRSSFRTLVQEGRVEFAGGSWVHNDQATVDYLQIIDQYTWGLRKLNDTLGPCGKPKAAWSIDNYGHSREQASLLAQMGYDGLFIGRVDHKTREAMIEEDRMEFMWRGSDVLGKMSDIMTHALYNLYNAPDGFCFDFLCNDDPIVDDVDNKAYNAEKRVGEFMAQIERQAKYYDHDNIMVMMGGDFTYQSAASWFINIDKLINHVNTHPANMSDVNIFYSTPSCYMKAIYLYGRRDKAIYTEKADFLPYGSDANTYWTGFYTSRPSLKLLARKAHVFLQILKQLSVMSKMGDSYELHLLRHASSLVLHHDAITGTSQQHVIDDFVRMLYDAVDTASRKASTLLSALTPTWGGSRRSKSQHQFITCLQLNVSACPFAEAQESSPFVVLVYNPLSTKTYFHVQLPAIALHYNIRDANDEEVEYQLLPMTTAIINLPGRKSAAIQNLVFEAENIPPLGYVAYCITPVRDQLEENEYKKTVKLDKEGVDQELIPMIANEYLRVTVDKETGLLESVQHLDGVKIQISQNFFFYSQTNSNMQSGAYSFRPQTERPNPVASTVTYSAVRGPLVKEIRQRFSDWCSQVIRLYRGEEFIELEWVVGPLPIGPDVGKEVVSVFSTNMSNHGIFYTDSNGRQMMKRTCLNESMIQQTKMNVAACYYPVTSRICLDSTNTSTSMCVLTDRPQGGTSYNEGEIELMIHRRLLTDDGFGLEESLNEEEHGIGLVVKGKHRIHFGNSKQEVDGLSFSERVSSASKRWMMEPWLFFTTGEKMTRRKWQNIRNKRFSAIRSTSLPRHVHILTLEPWKQGSVLLRLENTIGTTKENKKRNIQTEEHTKSSLITVELRKLFHPLRLMMIRETTLAANQWLDDARQMDWSTRYVYDGADDGILPEDVVDYESHEDLRSAKRPSPKDTDDVKADPYSDEEQNPTIKQRKLEKSQSKVKIYNEDYELIRRKRFVNGSESISTNNNITTVIHEDTTKYDIKTTTTSSANNMTTLKIKDKVSKKLVTKAVTSHTTTEKFETTASMQRYLQPNEQEEVFDEVENEDEDIESSEENISNLKKRSPERKSPKVKSIKDDIKLERKAGCKNQSDADDDGLTRSIYEMYYKATSKPNSFKPFIRHLTEIDQTALETKPVKITEKEMNKSKPKKFHKNNKKNYFNAIDKSSTATKEHAKQVDKNRNGKSKPLSVDMPFFMSEETSKNFVDNIGRLENERPKPIKRKKNSGEEDIDTSAEDEKSEEGVNKREKRAPPSNEKESFSSNSNTEQPENDYTITLRATQIRTFVIWFNNKKPYV